MRDIIGPALVNLGRQRPDFFVVDADNGPATRIRAFGDAYPERYVNVGCAEQNLVGVSAGLSLSGAPVIAATFSVFLLGRAYDQVRNTIAASRLPVVLLGTHTGLSTGADGGSHCCPEDIALMRLLPGMQILIPACSDDVTPMLQLALHTNGPSYIRIPRNDLWPAPPDVVPALDLKHPALRCWRKGDDVAIVTAGLLLPRAIQAAEEISKTGHSVAIYDMPCLDIDPAETRNTLGGFRGVISVEDHWPVGGLGEMVSSILSRQSNQKFKKITAEHHFPSSGDADEVLDDMGLSVGSIQSAVQNILNG